MRNAVGNVQSALILGATSDLARATAQRLAIGGCRRFVLAARNVDDLDILESELRSAGATSITRLPFDASDQATHQAVIDQSISGGDIDLALVAFGALGPQDLLDTPVDVLMGEAAVNFTGAASCVLRLGRAFVSQGHGTIILLSSVAGERVRSSLGIYGAAKGGADSLLLALGDALRNEGVRVMCVRPGYVHTKMTANLPAAPLATTPERVAVDIERGLARGAEIVWTPSAMRLVLLVLRHLPRAVFRRLPL